MSHSRPASEINLTRDYRPAPTRYSEMSYRRVGRSGLQLPAISLGMWQNLGGSDPPEGSRAMVLRAFDLGITHFDFANNYGRPPGSAEAGFGRLLQSDLAPHRDELLISTKAGYDMWPGPYGNMGSRKYLVASLDQSLRRLGVDYVDIFYSHRFDPETPLEETMGALDHLVRQGKALHAGVSTYSAEQTRRACSILSALGTPCLVSQIAYSLFNRWPERGLLSELAAQGVGAAVFSVLAQGLLSERYLQGVPAGSRASKDGSTLDGRTLNETRLAQVRRLQPIAKARGQTLAQMAIAWTLRQPGVATAIVGASSPEQIEENVAALAKLSFSHEELAAIDACSPLPEDEIVRWRPPADRPAPPSGS